MSAIPYVSPFQKIPFLVFPLFYRILRTRNLSAWQLQVWIKTRLSTKLKPNWEYKQECRFFGFWNACISGAITVTGTSITVSLMKWDPYNITGTQDNWALLSNGDDPRKSQKDKYPRNLESVEIQENVMMTRIEGICIPNNRTVRKHNKSHCLRVANHLTFVYVHYLSNVW